MAEKIIATHVIATEKIVHSNKYCCNDKLFHGKKNEVATRNNP